MRKLNGAYAIEVLNGRLNGSASQVESNNSGFKNATYTKKIGGRSKVSVQCQKFNMRDFMSKMSGINQDSRIKEGKQIKMLPDPFKNEIDDIFGFMQAEKVIIEKGDYDLLDENKKKLFSKSKNSYQANITKKRKARLQMNALINVSNRKINWEWNVASSTTDSMPYQQEVYSGVHASIFNLDIDNIGKFKVSNIPSEFRDYSNDEGECVKDLNDDERYIRVSNVLNALEYLAISSNQTNHLTDTKPKFIILGDYGWGNNAFQGIIKENGIDVEMLKECIEQNEKYRMSNIFIGINKFFDDKFNNIIDDLKNEFEDYSFVKISNVKDAFESYKDELKVNMNIAVKE